MSARRRKVEFAFDDRADVHALPPDSLMFSIPPAPASWGEQLARLDDRIARVNAELRRLREQRDQLMRHAH